MFMWNELQCNEFGEYVRGELEIIQSEINNDEICDKTRGGDFLVSAMTFLVSINTRLDGEQKYHKDKALLTKRVSNEFDYMIAA